MFDFFLSVVSFSPISLNERRDGLTKGLGK